MPVVASGGAGTAEHLRAGLAEGRASAALAASMFHFRETTVAEAKAYLAAHGVAVRPAPVLPGVSSVRLPEAGAPEAP